MPDIEPAAEPQGAPQLRMVAMPKDANPSGRIFGGWTLSQMDLAGGTFAAAMTEGPIVTVAIDAMRFLRPVEVGDVVSCYCSLVEQGEHSLKIRIETWARGRGRPDSEKVTEGVYTFVALDEHGKLRPVPDQASDQ